MCTVSRGLLPGHVLPTPSFPQTVSSGPNVSAEKSADSLVGAPGGEVTAFLALSLTSVLSQNTVTY